MQLNRFIKDLAFVQVVNFLVKPLWILAVDRVVQNQLGEALYGQYYLAFNLAAMLVIVTDLGLNNYLTKDGVSSNKSSLNIITGSIKLKLGLSLVYLFILVMIGWQRDIPLGILVWVGINQVLLSISQWMRVWFNVSRAFRKESLIAIADRLVAILLWLGVVILFSFDNQELLHLFLGVQSVGLAVAISIALFYVIKEQGSASLDNTTAVGKVIWSCMPFTLLAFFMAAFTRADVILMDLLLSSNSAEYHIGVYAQGFVILNAGNMMAALFGTMLLPIFTKQIKNRENVLPIMRTSTLILGSSALVLFVILQFWGREIYSLYYKTDAIRDVNFAYKLKTFCTVIIVYIPMALTYIFGTYLTALGKLKELVVLAMVTFGLNIALNLMLQPDLQAYGAAIAALVAQGFFCIMCIVMSAWFLNRRQQPTST